MDSIARTSLLTAAMRAVESMRSETEGRLFSDPYAELLAGIEGKNLLEKAIAIAGDQPAVAIRTNFMDRRIKVWAEKRYLQLVILAAGMDTRAYRLDLPRDFRVYELDRPEVIDYKGAILARAIPTCTRVPISVDLKLNWSELLLKRGFKEGYPTIWLVEGLVMYLTENEVKNLFRQINSIARAQDILLCDILTTALLNAPHMASQLKFLSEIGAPWQFGTDEPELFLQDFGWKATAYQPGEVAPTRWPFPTAPRHIPNIPRGFYLEGVKI